MRFLKSQQGICNENGTYCPEASKARCRIPLVPTLIRDRTRSDTGSMMSTTPAVVPAYILLPHELHAAQARDDL